MTTRPEISPRFPRSSQSGQAIVLIALSMIVLMAFSVLALDGGRYYEQRRVNQNAADQSSLAGIYYFSANAATRTALGTWNAIKAAAQNNGITNTGATTSDGRRVLQAYWVDSTGALISGGEFTDATSSNTIPSTTYAIKVTTRIEYQTFMAGLVGFQTITAEASSIARQSVVASAPPISVWPYSGYMGGVGCDNGSGSTSAMNYALEWYNGQNGGFKGDLYVNGNGAFLTSDHVDMNLHKASVKNYVDVLSGSSIVHESPNTTQPGIVINTSSWASPVSPVNGSGTNSFSSAWPSIMYAPGETHPLDASDFEPPHGTFTTGGIMYRLWVQQYGTANVSTYWHYIANQTDTNGNGSADENGLQIPSTGVGIYWVDGNVSLTVDTGDQNLSIMSKGFVDITFKNNTSFGSAGDMAANISVLAGGDRGNGHRCANNPTDWVFHTVANQSYFSGFIYAPYGLVVFEGNGNNGHTQAWGVYANSLRVGIDSNSKGNNMNFDFQQKFEIPIPTTGLMGNN